MSAPEGEDPARREAEALKKAMQVIDKKIETLKKEAAEKMDLQYRKIINELKELSEKLSKMQNLTSEERRKLGEETIFERMITIKDNLERLENNSEWYGFIDMDVNNLLEDELHSLNHREQTVTALLKHYGVNRETDPSNNGYFIKELQTKKDTYLENARSEIVKFEKMAQSLDEKRKAENISLEERHKTLDDELKKLQEQKAELLRKMTLASDKTPVQEPLKSSVEKVAPDKEPVQSKKHVIDQKKPIKLNPKPFKVQGNDPTDNFKALSNQFIEELEQYLEIHKAQSNDNGSRLFGFIHFSNHELKNAIAQEATEKFRAVLSEINQGVPISKEKIKEFEEDMDVFIQSNAKATVGFKGKLDKILTNAKNGINEINNELIQKERPTAGGFGG